MKKIILTTVIQCLIVSIVESKEVCCHPSFVNVDTLPTQQLVTFLQQMNVESYYGKPVDSFMLAIDAIPYNMKVYGGSNSQGAIFRASLLRYNYSGGQTIIIHVREFTHMNKYSPTATWDVNLFRKEKIYKIEVYKNQNVCINGWCLE